MVVLQLDYLLYSAKRPKNRTIHKTHMIHICVIRTCLLISDASATGCTTLFFNPFLLVTSAHSRPLVKTAEQRIAHDLYAPASLIQAKSLF